MLNDLPANAPISWAGNTYTASQVLGIIHNTQYIISDASNFYNGGVGMAAAGQNGAPNVNTLNFRFFDGDLTNSGGMDYAASTYTNGQGLIAIALHEVGHMTQAGLQFNNLNRQYHRMENNNSDAGFNNSEYWSNNEAFANEFATAVATATGQTITEVSNYWEFNSRPPVEIYFDHMGM